MAEGTRTADIMQPGMTKVGTAEMTSAIQRELRKPQVNRKQRREPKWASVVNINASAAICGLASASHLSRPTAGGPVIRAVAAESLFGAGAIGSHARQPGVEPGWPTANGPTPQPGPATRHKNVTWTSHFGNRAGAATFA